MAAGNLGDLAGQALAVGADESRDVLTLSGDTDLAKRLKPCLDSSVDRVDQCAVKIEDDRAGIGQRRKAAQRRPRRNT